jgi:hypothetical protein
MDQRELIDTLHRLHRELEQHPQFDEPVKESLRQIARDIQVLVEPNQSSEDEGSQLRQRLAQLVTDFEDEHPTLARTLLDLSEILARIGI